MCVIMYVVCRGMIWCMMWCVGGDMVCVCVIMYDVVCRG